MPHLAERARKRLPAILAGLAGTACAACCLLPVLLAAGLLTGGAWAFLSDWMPGIAAVFAAAAVLSWWRMRSRHTHETGCSCT